MCIRDSLYAGGFLAQLFGNYAAWKQGGGIPGDGTSPAMASPDFFTCLASVFRPPYGVYGVLICIGLLAILLLMVMRMGYSDTGEYDSDRNFIYSAKGTYGTSGWMSRKEMAGVLDLVPDLRKHKGVVLGMLDNKAVCIPENPHINGNLAVYGSSGSMKSHPSGGGPRRIPDHFRSEKRALRKIQRVSAGSGVLCQGVQFSQSGKLGQLELPFRSGGAGTDGAAFCRCHH